FQITSATNGATTIAEAIAALGDPLDDWLTDDPGNVDLGAVITAWSGGAKAVRGTDLILNGGGHNDSANNGVYIFDFAGTSEPTGWRVRGLSEISDVQVADTYADGGCRAAHTYDGLWVHNGYLYRAMGAPWSPSGGGTDAVCKLNLATGAWTQLTDFPGGSVIQVGSIFDPETGKALVGGGALGGSVRFFDPSDDSWSAAKTVDVG